MQEIQEAKWMQLEEYENSEFAKSHSTIKEFVRCMRAYKDGVYAGFSAMALPGMMRGGPQLVIHGLDEPSDET